LGVDSSAAESIEKHPDDLTRRVADIHSRQPHIGAFPFGWLLGFFQAFRLTIK
jgi:hypothetical protein